jgi:hypothetical protein
MGPVGGLDVLVKKILPFPGLEPQIVQPVAIIPAALPSLRKTGNVT